MKILLVHIFFAEIFNSGSNSIVFGTYKNLNKYGIESYIFAEDIKPYIDKKYKYSKYFPKSSFFRDGRFISELKYNINCIYNFEAKNKLEQMLDEIKPDLVHIHTTWDLSFSILKPIKKRNIPIIYTAHDIGLFCSAVFFCGVNYCKECKGINTLPCVLKKCINGNLSSSIYFAIKSLTERLLGVYKDIDLYLAVSENEKQYIVDMGIDERKIQVLPNFVSNDFKNSEINTGEYFFYAGGVCKHKGIDTLLEAIKLLPKEIKFHIAGAGDIYYLRNYLMKNRITNVRIMGNLTKEQMREEYKRCISVIMPSECFETFGMVNVEAALSSKPSICSDIGGLSNVVENNKTGLIFEPRNSNQLKKCILNYWNNPMLAKEHGLNAYKKASKEYEENEYYKKLISIYKNIGNF